jgi:hypothetical protein
MDSLKSVIVQESVIGRKTKPLRERYGIQHRIQRHVADCHLGETNFCLAKIPVEAMGKDDCVLSSA